MIDFAHLNNDNDPQVVVFDEEGKCYTVIEDIPMFPGGVDALRKYMAAHVEYPQSAVDRDVSGLVIIKFVVREDGFVGEVSVQKSIASDNNQVLMSEKDYLESEKAKEMSYEAYCEQFQAYVDACKDCDEECVRVIKSLPRFTPGKQEGKEVPFWFYFPLRFMIE